MVFSSHLFLFGFLPLALAAYYLAPRRARNLVITITSCVFYGWWNPIYLLLLLATTVIDYWAGLVQATERWWPFGAELRQLEPGGPRSRQQRMALLLSIVSNLGLLAFFKYWNFGVSSWNTVADAAGLSMARIDSVMRVVLPIGISFYTFQAISYSIDVYRGRARATRNFIDFACFVWLWPAARRRAHRPLHRDRRPARRPPRHDRPLRARRRASSPSGWARRCCSRTRAARSPTPCSTPRRRPCSTPGSASAPTRSRSTSTSPATRTWRSGSA